MEKKETKILSYRVIIEKEHYDDGTPVYTAYVPTLEELLKNLWGGR